MNDLLRVNNLSISFPVKDTKLRVLDEVSFAIKKNETLGLVGESGSGKTVTALSIINLMSSNTCCESGSIIFKGENLLEKTEKELLEIRGTLISMIFQSSRKALNPLKKVISQVERAVWLNQGLGRKERNVQALQLLQKVGFSDAINRANSYPNQLSTGMCQRVMIAMMIAARPELLIADEPTTALDVTIAAQIYELLAEIKQETEMSILLITHDLGIVAENCSHVVVMHAGHVVETGNVSTIFSVPKHPYTKHLLHSQMRVDREVTPSLGKTSAVEERDYSVTGCRYQRKCEISENICVTTKPILEEISHGHAVRCHKWKGAYNGRY